VARVLVARGRAVGVLDHGVAINQSVFYFPAMNAQWVGGWDSFLVMLYWREFKNECGAQRNCLVWLRGTVSGKDDIHALVTHE
jgi:hypothetical protein